MKNITMDQGDKLDYFYEQFIVKLLNSTFRLSVQWRHHRGKKESNDLETEKKRRECPTEVPVLCTRNQPLPAATDSFSVSPILILTHTGGCDCIRQDTAAQQAPSPGSPSRSPPRP